MARYQVILTYDGSQYQGYQRQRRAKTVQGEVESALYKLGWYGQSILAAGRTDTGVHAIGQVVAFDLDWKHPARDLQAALNSLLPPAIAVRSVEEVEDTFHPRYDATSRKYRFHIFCQPTRFPLREQFAWRVWPVIDLGKMSQAAESLIGRHDFAAFGSPTRPGGSTWRTVFQASWQTVPGLWEMPDVVFEICADAFLYRMVRRLVYVLVAIGHGKMEPSEIASNLETPPAALLQGLAPPNGLVLVSVSYVQKAK